MNFMAVMVCAQALAASPEFSQMMKPPLHHHPTIVKMLEMNNQLRESVGLKPQQISAELTKAAQDQAWYMARSGSFSHGSNGGPQGRARKSGFHGMVRENIAMGYQTVQVVFQGWRGSGGHWASITCDAPLAGFGYALSSSGTAYWVGVYGYPTTDDLQPKTETRFAD
jgi:uncharacterized protein YkwD